VAAKRAELEAALREAGVRVAPDAKTKLYQYYVRGPPPCPARACTLHCKHCRTVYDMEGCTLPWPFYLQWPCFALQLVGSTSYVILPYSRCGDPTQMCEGAQSAKRCCRFAFTVRAACLAMADTMSWQGLGPANRGGCGCAAALRAVLDPPAGCPAAHRVH